MIERNQYTAELERQELTAKCHALIAVIANRPGSTKLLRGVLPTLETFAGYKSNRRKQRTS